MMEGMELSQIPTTSMKVSPRLVAMNHVLELSSLELQELIAGELAENPALELVDKPRCPRCGAALDKPGAPVCPHCLSRLATAGPMGAEGQAGAPEAGDDASLPHDGDAFYYDEGPSMARRDPDDDFDPLGHVAAEPTLQEHLLRELGAVLAPAQLAIAEFLVGNLDERGFLECSVAEAARALGVDEAAVVAVLRELQQQEPVGIGARDLRECLLLQLDYLAERGVRPPHVRAIVADHLRALGEHKYSKIAQALRVPSAAVAEAAQFIRQHLNPFPAQGAGRAGGPGAAPGAPTGYVLPDVIIAKRDRGFEVDVVESKRFFLRI
ncbi:MAG TPA: hypothetical protein VHS99_00785, partial [Chloroflexota bacterium]|nr:hypothetical protein [Chloroflexota bacterium]